MNRLFVHLFILMLMVAPTFAPAGSLTPPGAPAPTFKTLEEVEPRIEVSAQNTPGNATNVFRITSPGSYYLSANVAGVIGRNGISIESDQVVLDLNGFRLNGVTSSLSGIKVIGSRSGITIRNGTAFGWGENGIDLTGASEVLIENVHSSNNGNTGNGQAGFVVTSIAVIRNCTASNNFGDGFTALTTVVFESCTARNNGLDGFKVTGLSGIIRDCSSRQNGGSGFVANSNAWIVGSVAHQNAKSGIVVDSGSIVRENNSRLNGSADNPGAGIEITGSRNRIEENNCTDNYRGIRASAGGNLILRNSASGSTDGINYGFVEGNRYGQIVDITAAGTAGATGNAANGTLTSVHPFANFAF